MCVCVEECVLHSKFGARGCVGKGERAGAAGGGEARAGAV